MAKDRDEMYDDLEQRTKENYNTRKGERHPGVFKPDEVFPMWFAAKGEHRVNIIPYRAGPNDPDLEEGRWQYVLIVYIHRNVGPRDLQFICMEATYHKPCSICVEANRIRKKGPPDGKRAEQEYEDQLSALKPSRRNVYNIECLDSDEEMDKGIQVWEIAHWFMEQPLQDQAKIPKSEGGGYTIFSNPKTGKTVFFERTGEGFKSTKYTGHRFLNRREPIPKEVMEQALTLDELVHIPTFEEVKDAFWDEGGVPDADRSEKDDERYASDPDPEEEVPRSRSRSSAEEWVKEDEEPPRRRSVPKDEPEDEPEQEPEEEAPPRRRSRSHTENEEQPKPSKRGGLHPVVVNDDEPTCPVARGVFGEDIDRHDECDGCSVWKDCAKAERAARKDKDEKAEQGAKGRSRSRRELLDDEDDIPF